MRWACAFPLRRLAQNCCLDFGLQHIHCKSTQKRPLLRCPCAVARCTNSVTAKRTGCGCAPRITCCPRHISVIASHFAASKHCQGPARWGAMLQAQEGRTDCTYILQITETYQSSQFRCDCLGSKLVLLPSAISTCPNIWPSALSPHTLSSRHRCASFMLRLLLAALWDALECTDLLSWSWTASRT